MALCSRGKADSDIADNLGLSCLDKVVVHTTVHVRNVNQHFKGHVQFM